MPACGTALAQLIHCRVLLFGSLQLREPGQEMAYRIPFAVRHKSNINKDGRYFITLYDHTTGKPLKLEDFEAKVCAGLRVIMTSSDIE